jgi:hypothetical protein
MKKLLFIILFCLIPSIAFGSPFLVCDPQTGVTSYHLRGPAWVPASVEAQPDGSLKMDVSGADVGSNSLYVAACNVDSIWGEVCSLESPFVFTRPGLPSTPANLGLSK